MKASDLIDGLYKEASKQIYHLSEQNLDGEVLEPRVPDNTLTTDGYEDGSTPRISFSTSVGGALTGISNNLAGKTFYIHVPEAEADYYKPTKAEVPDVSCSHEVWVKEPVRLKLHKAIRVTSAQDKPMKYKYGDNIAETYKWNYDYVKPDTGTLHKEAANKMTEMFNLGKLTAKGLDNLEAHVPSIEGLAAVSRAGRHNGEVISRLRRKHGPDAVNVSRNAEPEGVMTGHTHIDYNGEHDLPTNFKAGISLPDAAERDTLPDLEEEYQSLGEYYNNLDDHTAKQLRGYIANHEISGEAQRMDKIIEGIKASGRDADNVNDWTIRSHATPDVVINDGALVRSFNGKAKNIVDQTSFDVDSGFSNKSGELTQNDFIQEVLDRDKDVPFYAYPFSHSDRKELMDTAHNINTGFNKGDDLMRDSVSDHVIGGSTFMKDAKTPKQASDLISELYKEASSPNIAYHASPVQDIKKFRKSEDTSGANKGKIIFVSKDPSFCSAFGVRWNDANARLTVETTTQKPPTNKNYKRTVLRFTEAVDLDAPCSMYQLKGKFKPLRYEDDIEEYTDGDVEIVSEEKFDTFRAMAKKYGLEIREIKQSTVLREMKWKKTSNFEKAAEEHLESIRERSKVKKKKNVDAILTGKTASNTIDTLYKEATDKEPNQAVGAGLIGGSALMMHQGIKETDKGNLTGRETLYHNTDKRNVESIADKGVLASKANEANAYTRRDILKNKVDPSKLDDLTYFAKKEDVAEDVGRTRSYYQAVAEGKVNPGVLGRLNPHTVQSALDAVPNKTLTVKAPVWKMTQSENPELRGAKTWQEFHKHFPSLDEHTAKKVFHDLSDNTVVIKGNMDPKYIINSKHYQGANLAEVADFAKHNPRRFGRAALPLAGASILGALGGAQFARHDKSASEMIDSLYKESR